MVTIHFYLYGAACGVIGYMIGAFFGYLIWGRRR